jgi:TatA/E family protein of Tat protein translocase
MPFGLGFGETLLILAVILLFFGPKRLPDAAASLGKGIREFKRAVSGVGEEFTAAQQPVATPLPPHSTFVCTGADPYAVPAGADEAPASLSPLVPAATSVEPAVAGHPAPTDGEASRG